MLAIIDIDGNVYAACEIVTMPTGALVLLGSWPVAAAPVLLAGEVARICPVDTDACGSLAEWAESRGYTMAVA